MSATGKKKGEPLRLTEAQQPLLYCVEPEKHILSLSFPIDMETCSSVNVDLEEPKEEKF